MIENKLVYAREELRYFKANKIKSTNIDWKDSIYKATIISCMNCSMIYIKNDLTRFVKNAFSHYIRFNILVFIIIMVPVPILASKLLTTKRLASKLLASNSRSLNRKEV